VPNKTSKINGFTGFFFLSFWQKYLVSFRDNRFPKQKGNYYERSKKKERRGIDISGI